MPIKILMPALSPTMTEGNLAKWHKKAGDKVKSGDVLAEIETDKAVMEVEAVDEGVLGKILVAEGTEGVKVNEIIALLLEEGEDAASLDKVAVIGGGAAASTAANPAAADSAVHEAATATPAVAQGAASAVAAIPMHQGVSVSNDTGRVFASPLARRLAAEGGLSLAGLVGSGPHGRIVRQDVVQALQAKPAGAKAATSSASSSASGSSAADLFGLPEFRLEPHSTMRKVIARRLSESKQTVPHFYLTVDCQLDRLMALRHEINASLDAKISVNDFILKACAIALTKVPAANASWTEEGVRYYTQADVSVAVAIEGGLITPIVRAAQDKGLAAISREMKDLAARARDNKL
ncbi:MAG: pyruvate dehydrogenase complex dihydrolipoamide acetyltransferase, partial [Alphaproteobacteria bacterium]|nr:pyruvate dehydrogenase complex dihydrolipoamide acetyltransferase [Alphaproteobacteria bacterium]